ncbi:hypothetical protein KKH23_04860, partial [Patescibacteria group bacterium]|nr:hypothetical protein [Patescibacteria group bacterium]
QKYYQRHPNNTGGALFNQVGVMCGHGEMYTSEYNASINWAGMSGMTAIVSANGVITSGAAGAANCVGAVIKAPTSSDATLGIAFNVNII